MQESKQLIEHITKKNVDIPEDTLNIPEVKFDKPEVIKRPEVSLNIPEVKFDKPEVIKSIDKYTYRKTIIKKSMNYFLSELIEIIQDYDITELKEKQITYDQKHGHIYDDFQYSPQHVCSFLLTLPMCKKLICKIIKLNNGFLASGSFQGLVQIWDPESGKCIKQLDALERIFADEYYPQLLEMCQVTDDLIIITNFNVHYGAKNNIYALNILTNNIQKLYKEENSYTCSIINISNDIFVTMTNGMILTWYISLYDESRKADQTIECISKKNYKQLINNSSQILMITENNMIAICSINTNNKREYYYIVSVNFETEEEKYYSFKKSQRIYSHNIINDYIFLTTDNNDGKSYNHFVLDKNTLNVVKRLMNHDNCTLMFVHLINNLIAMIVTNNTQTITNEKNNIIQNNNYIKIIETSNKYFVCTQTINIGDEKIRTATSYENGLVTVNYLSEIKVYDYT